MVFVTCHFLKVSLSHCHFLAMCAPIIYVYTYFNNQYRLWPDVVRHRIKDTYTYFGGSLVITAASAVAIARTPALMRLVASNSLWVRSALVILITSTWQRWVGVC